MHLMTPQRWLETYFDQTSQPSIQQLHRWLRDGKIPGKKVGGTWFIDAHAWLADGDELVARVLDAG